MLGPMKRRTSILVDDALDALLTEAQTHLGTTGLKATVDAALEAVVRDARRQEFISWLRDGGPGTDLSPEMLAEVRGQWR